MSTLPPATDPPQDFPRVLEPEWEAMMARAEEPESPDWHIEELDAIGVECRILRYEALDGPRLLPRFPFPDDLHDRRKALRMEAWLCVRPAAMSAMPASIFCRT